MNGDELNIFIERYAKQYKTKTALLLSGEWGSGKSYYINNCLCPYLKKKKVKCVVVSLYGVDSLADLSKQIYLSIRCAPLTKKSEAKECLSIVGHNIINNALSFKGLSIGFSDNELMKLYESVNLEKVLLVIEDVERTTIDILNLLGFINGLVEYDGAKVLLVANEKELLRLEDDHDLGLDFNTPITTKIAEKETSTIEPRVLQYKHIKEKTIGDTIQFKADVVESVSSILNEFSGVWVKALSNQKEIEKIASILVSHCNRNLRVLLYALQKCNDIFVDIANAQEFEESFYQVSFEGMLVVSSKFMSSDIPAWEGTEHISAHLGLPASPLFRFVYDYLRWNNTSVSDVLAASVEYENYRYFEKNATRDNDQDLFVLSNYHTQKETDVVESLKNIEKKLKSKDFVGVYAYEKLGYLAITAGSVVGYNTENICSSMIKNAERMCKKHHFSSQEVIWGIYGGKFDDKIIQNKYCCFINDLVSSIDNQEESIDFSYDPEDIHDLYMDSCRNKHHYIIHHSFLGRFEVGKLMLMLEKCTAEQLDDFRGLLFVFYRDVAKNEYEESDKVALELLLKSLQERTSEKNNNWDKIQLLQIKYLVTNLNEFIAKL